MNMRPNIRWNATLAKYLAKTYVVNLLAFLFALLTVVYLFDTVELIRRANKQEALPISLVLQMGLLKLPEVGQILLPFALLFSAMFTFWQLSRRHELVIVRSSGVSAWQFLAPMLLVAMAAGVLQMSVINPLGALFLTRFEQLESNYLNNAPSQIAIFKEGLWLKQAADDGYVILRARKIERPDWIFRGVTIFFFDSENRFQKRLDTDDVRLQKGIWLFAAPALFDQHNNGTILQNTFLPTDLTAQDIEESFASPETLSFWQLPTQIRIFEETGFDTTRLHMHYQALLAKPLFFPSMILLAATVSMRPPRNRGGFKLIVAGILMGFLVFFFSSFLQALGASGQIPVLLAAWSPGLIACFLGLTAIMNLEDG